MYFKHGSVDTLIQSAFDYAKAVSDISETGFGLNLSW